MLRITPLQTTPAPAFRLEGRLVGPWVEELRTACLPLAARTLRLDLSAVSYADDDGLALLSEFLGAGVELSCSPFIAALLTQEAQ